VFVANLPTWNFVLKGGRELIEAYRILRSKGEKITLTLVGPVPSDIAAEYSKVPGIFLAGKVSRAELWRLYRDSDIYVMPSFSDTFGMVFLEAMAFSLPIIALNRPYTREIVKDGESGLLVDLSDSSIRWFDEDGCPTMNSETFIELVLRSNIDTGVVNSLVEKIGWLVNDPKLRRALGTNGREEVMNGRFSVINRNKRLQEIYLAATK
jgi:glycosyltransferase involved in cell wall biosynthesis